MFDSSIRIDSRQQAQETLTRWFALLLWLIWLGRLWQRLGLFQLQSPVFISPKADNLYWILHYANIPQALLQFAPLSLAIDMLLFTLPLIMLRYPLWRIPAWGYLPSALLYQMAYNSSATQHEHTWVGVLAVALLLCFKDGLRFGLLLSAIRHYACFLMASAALWKIGRGALWQTGQMENILKLQHSEWLSADTSGLWSSWIAWLVSNPALATSLWYLATLLELVFLVGFFTRRFDMLLFWAFWLFILCDFWVMGLHFWELGILTLLFLKRLWRE